MSLISKAINALFNGVSQQPATMRLDSQSEAQVNGYATVADGLGKRPATQHLSTLAAFTDEDSFVHIINRDPTEQYAVVVSDGTLGVYNLADGSAETVVLEVGTLRADSTGYVIGDVVRLTAYNGRLLRCTTAGTSGVGEPTISSTIGSTVADGSVTWTVINHPLEVPAGYDAKDVFQMVTVADYSFLVNKTVTVQTGAVDTAEPTQFSYWYFPDDWREGADNTRYYVPTFGTDKGSKQTIADLPLPSDSVPPAEGDYYEITGEAVDGFSKYYVIYRSGVWVETHERTQSIRLDEASMPYALVREADGDFHLRQFGWVPRLFGDNNSNPAPTFVGRKITDVGYHRNRLTFSAGENIIFSCAGDYGNFFRNTVTQLLDSDVVDVAVSTKGVNNINHLLPVESGLMFFSDSAQFVLNVDELLTPSSVSIDVATSYKMNPDVPPISVGQDVYYPTQAGDWSRVREYTLAGSGDLATDATDITAHVPRYIPSSITKLTGSSNEDVLFAISDKVGYKNRVYVYKYFYSGGEKVQSAWGYWQFADDDVVLDVEIIDNELYFIISRTDAVYLEKMDIQSADFPLAMTFDVLLDRRHLFTGGQKSYDSTDTEFTIPYVVKASEQPDFRLVLADGATVGRVLDPSAYEWTSTTTVKFAGDWTSVEVLGGYNYTFSYQFSEQFFPRGDGQVITTGRYQLRTITVYFEDTAFFNTVVAPYGDDPLTEDIVTSGLTDFTGKTLGSGNLLLGTPVFSTGTYSFQIYGNSKVATVSLTNDQPFASKFVSAEVEGFYTNRARAM